MWWLSFPVLVLLLLVLLLWGVHRRRHDGAIRLLDRFPVTLALMDGSRRSGVLRIQRGGLTLDYALPATGRTPPAPITYLHYEPEWQELDAIYRFTDELSKQDRKRRGRQLDALSGLKRQARAWQPGLWLDAFIEQLVALLARWQQRPFPIPVFQQLPHSQRTLLVGYAGDHFNDLLTQNLGKQVVARHFAHNIIHRFQGTLLAYSRYFLLLAQVPVSQQVQLALQPEKGSGQLYALRWRWQNDQLELRNLSAYPLLLDKMTLDGQVRDLSMMIAADAAFTLHIKATEQTHCQLSARIVREADVLLPRNRAIVRYAATLPAHLAALDVGVALAPPQGSDAEEQRLRRELQSHPTDAASAAALARHLHQMGQLDEAERYYQQALTAARRLPDGGQRVQLELMQLRMYREDQGEVKQ
jgi:tetratricopeptide (TPR) repeat protein